MQLTVADDGVGMEPEVLARAFEPFFTTKPAERGSGLGLATAHSVVTDAGGRIGIASQPGVGTEVRVCLPKTTPAQVAERTEGRGAELGMR